MNKILLVLLGLTVLSLLVGVAYYHNSSKNPCLGASEIPTPVYDLWVHWKTKNGKKYGNEDFTRLNIFYSNYKKVMQHQANPSRTHDIGFTKFMDLTPEEFKLKYLSSVIPQQPTETTILSTVNLPTSVDWRTAGAVTPVKDQGPCGSCWAFSTTGSLEARCYLDGFGLHEFSEQQLIDCSGSFGNQGCSGGFMNNAWDYLEKNCLAYEGEYPYAAVDNTCKYVKGRNKISTYTTIAQGNVDQLAAGIAGYLIFFHCHMYFWLHETKGKNSK